MPLETSRVCFELCIPRYALAFISVMSQLQIHKAGRDETRDVGAVDDAMAYSGGTDCNHDHDWVYFRVKCSKWRCISCFGTIHDLSGRR